MKEIGFIRTENGEWLDLEYREALGMICMDGPPETLNALFGVIGGVHVKLSNGAEIRGTYTGKSNEIKTHA
jgi:hypothetical protein